VGPEGEHDLRGHWERSPAGLARVDGAGLRILCYRSRRHPSVLPAAPFRSYLEERGLQHVIAARRETGATDAPGRELYSRCAKALFRVGPGASNGEAESDVRFDRRAGFPLELVPASDPTRARPGDRLSFVLLHRGDPLAGALLRAVSKGKPGEVQEVRTDEEGRARIEIDAPGTWLISAVHMVGAPPETGADWESFWASLVFEIPRPPAAEPSEEEARRDDGEAPPAREQRSGRRVRMPAAARTGTLSAERVGAARAKRRLPWPRAIPASVIPKTRRETGTGPRIGRPWTPGICSSMS
jgi:hypothetical protein